MDKAWKYRLVGALGALPVLGLIWLLLPQRTDLARDMIEARRGELTARVEALLAVRPKLDKLGPASLEGQVRDSTPDYSRARPLLPFMPRSFQSFP